MEERGPLSVKVRKVSLGEAEDILFPLCGKKVLKERLVIGRGGGVKGLKREVVSVLPGVLGLVEDGNRLLLNLCGPDMKLRVFPIFPDENLIGVQRHRNGAKSVVIHGPGDGGEGEEKRVRRFTVLPAARQR